MALSNRRHAKKLPGNPGSFVFLLQIGLLKGPQSADIRQGCVVFMPWREKSRKWPFCGRWREVASIVGDDGKRFS